MLQVVLDQPGVLQIVSLGDKNKLSCTRLCEPCVYHIMFAPLSEHGGRSASSLMALVCLSGSSHLPRDLWL